MTCVIAAAVISAPGEWDHRVLAACCAYPEHDPRDYNWPYSHLQYSEVIPDVMGSFIAMTFLNITFQGREIVEYGKPLSPSSLVMAPYVSYSAAPATLHTLMMVDPDVPYRDSPSEGEFLHWLVYDIPGDKLSEGKTLVEYAAPAPLPCPQSDRLCLDEHRVTFILWEQPRGPLHLHQEDLIRRQGTAAHRSRYHARDFAGRHQLGLQIAMNFFETQHEPPAALPWWHVSDNEPLAAVQHLIPHVERPSATPTWKEEL